MKTITPDELEMIEASPRYATWKVGNKVYGLENIELLSHLTIRQWLDGIKYLKHKHPTKVQIASIMAPVVKEKWQNLVQTFNDFEVDAFELNFSCPHGMPEKGIGMAIGISAEISALITEWVMEVSQKPVFVQLSPNVTDIVEIAQAVENAGADGVAAINSVQSLMGGIWIHFICCLMLMGKQLSAVIRGWRLNLSDCVVWRKCAKIVICRFWV